MKTLVEAGWHSGHGHDSCRRAQRRVAIASHAGHRRLRDHARRIGSPSSAHGFRARRPDARSPRGFWPVPRPRRTMVEDRPRHRRLHEPGCGHGVREVCRSRLPGPRIDDAVLGGEPPAHLRRPRRAAPRWRSTSEDGAGCRHHRACRGRAVGRGRNDSHVTGHVGSSGGSTSGRWASSRAGAAAAFSNGSTESRDAQLGEAITRAVATAAQGIVNAAPRLKSQG